MPVYQPLSRMSVPATVVTGLVVLLSGFAVGYRLCQALYDHLTGRKT